MASWSLQQQQRLAVEEQIIRSEMSHFAFYNKAQGGSTTVQGTHTTATNRSYNLCVWIKQAFPNEMPGLYVTTPCPLIGYGGRTIQSYGTSHEMHVWQSDYQDYAKICHCKTEFWTASDTILSVILKGILWLEAFEVHRRTGQSIDTLSLSFR